MLTGRPVFPVKLYGGFREYIVGPVPASGTRSFQTKHGTVHVWRDDNRLQSRRGNEACSTHYFDYDDVVKRYGKGFADEAKGNRAPIEEIWRAIDAARGGNGSLRSHPCAVDLVGSDYEGARVETGSHFVKSVFRARQLAQEVHGNPSSCYESKISRSAISLGKVRYVFVGDKDMLTYYQIEIKQKEYEMTDISHMSDAELDAFAAKIAEQKAKNAKRGDVINKVEALIAEAGFTFDELFPSRSGQAASSTTARKPRGSSKSASGLPKVTMGDTYYDPSGMNPDYVSARGTKPAWFTEYYEKNGELPPKK